jgi:hypothetical protein
VATRPCRQTDSLREAQQSTEHTKLTTHAARCSLHHVRKC